MPISPDVLKYRPEMNESERRFAMLALMMSHTLLHIAGHLEVDRRQQLLPLFKILADPHALLAELEAENPFQLSYTGKEKYFILELGILDLLNSFELGCPEDFRVEILTSRQSQQQFIKSELQKFLQLYGDQATEQWAILIQRGILCEYINTVTAALLKESKATIRVRAFPESRERHHARIAELSSRALELQALGRLAVTDFPYDQELAHQNHELGQQVASILEKIILDLFHSQKVPLLVNIRVFLTNSGTIGSFGSPWASAIYYSAGANGGLYNITESNIFLEPHFVGGDWATLIINRAIPNTPNGEFVPRPLDQLIALGVEEYIQTAIHPYTMIAFGRFAFVIEELLADLILNSISTQDISELGSSEHETLADCVPENQKTKPEGAELAAIVFKDVFQQAMQDGYLLHFLFDHHFENQVRALIPNIDLLQQMLQELHISDPSLLEELISQTNTQLLRSLNPLALRTEFLQLYQTRRREYERLKKDGNLYDPFYLQRFNLLSFVEKPF